VNGDQHGHRAVVPAFHLFVGEQPRQPLGEGEQPEDREFGRRARVHPVGAGDQYPVLFLRVKAGGSDLFTGAARRRLHPAQTVAVTYGIGQPLRGITGDAEQHLGLGEHRPSTAFLLGCAVERLDAAMVAGEPRRWQQVRG